jgi:uncharacterized protein (TIGR03435 family)
MKFAVVVIILCRLAVGQTPAAKLAFEVASIKPDASGRLTPADIASGRIHSFVDDQRADFGAISLSTLIQMAYGFPDDRITRPAWVAEQRFNIQAKLPEGAKKQQVPEMLQALLAERFKLAVHQEKKIVPVYFLTVSKDGPKLKTSTAADDVQIGCNGGFRKVCQKMTMQALAESLTTMGRLNALMVGADASLGIDRPVIDMTRLSGVYDFILEYGQARGGGRGGPGTASPPPADAAPRSVFDAVKDLGLRLDAGKNEFDSLIVDHVERTPTEN